MADEPEPDEVENPEEYKKRRDQGMSEEAAAREAESEREATTKEGDSQNYEKWSDEEIEEKARELGIENYREMDREELISALREEEA